MQSTSLAKVRLAGAIWRENGVSLVNFTPCVKDFSLRLNVVNHNDKLKRIGHLVDAFLGA